MERGIESPVQSEKNSELSSNQSLSAESPCSNSSSQNQFPKQIKIGGQKNSNPELSKGSSKVLLPYVSLQKSKNILPQQEQINVN